MQRKNLVFHFGLGHHASFPQKPVVKLVVQFMKLYHVIRSFARVPERHVLWHNSVEHHFHVVSHVRVPILVDGQAG